MAHLNAEENTAGKEIKTETSKHTKAAILFGIYTHVEVRLRFGGKHCLHFRDLAQFYACLMLITSMDWSSILKMELLRNVGKLLSNYTASYFRKIYYS
jgi:hypothetical protein